MIIEVPILVYFCPGFNTPRERNNNETTKTRSKQHPKQPRTGTSVTFHQMHNDSAENQPLCAREFFWVSWNYLDRQGFVWFFNSLFLFLFFLFLFIVYYCYYYLLLLHLFMQCDSSCQMREIALGISRCDKDLEKDWCCPKDWTWPKTKPIRETSRVMMDHVWSAFDVLLEWFSR